MEKRFQKTIRILLVLNVTLLLPVAAIMVMPRWVLLVILSLFVILEAVNLGIICREGILLFLTVPALWANVLLSYFDMDWGQPMMKIFLGITLCFKAVELGCAAVKRVKKRVQVQDYFSQNIELSIIMTILLDISSVM